MKSEGSPSGLSPHLSLCKLVEVLQWESAHDSWVEELLASLASTLGESMAEFANDQESFSTGLMLLGAGDRQSFFRMPGVIRRLLAYRLLKDRQRFAPGIAEDLATLLDQNNKSRPRLITEYIRLPLTQNNLGVPLLDLACKFEFPWITADTTALDDLGQHECSVVLDKISESMVFLAKEDSIAFRFFLGFTFYLALRSEPSRPESFSSCSFGKYPGLVLLLNAHASRIDKFRIVDALVHEAIHGAIYVIESLGEPLVHEEFPTSVKIKSPWSSRPLQIDQFAQACFVWWGLYNLWRKLAKTHENSRIHELLQASEIGFHRDPINLLLTEEASEWISPSGIDALKRIGSSFGAS